MYKLEWPWMAVSPASRAMSAVAEIFMLNGGHVPQKFSDVWSDRFSEKWLFSICKHYKLNKRRMLSLSSTVTHITVHWLHLCDHCKLLEARIVHVYNWHCARKIVILWKKFWLTVIITLVLIRPPMHWPRKVLKVLECKTRYACHRLLRLA